MSDTRRIQSVIAALFGSVAIDLLLVLASLTFVHIYSSTVGIVALLILPVYFLVLRKFSKPLAQSQKDVMADYAQVESNFIDTMHGVAEIKLLNKEHFFEKQSATVFGKFQQSFADLGKLNISFGVASDVVGVFFMMSMIGVASLQVITKQLQLGEMVALLGMSGNIVPAVNRLVIANVQIQEAKVAFDRMFEFTSMEKEQKEGTISSLDLREGFSVELKSMSFRFPGRKQILTNVSLILREGEMVSLLGESGGGKSTTLQLIQKFYRPEKGAILVDGKNLEEIDHKTWRSLLSCVPQEVKIFNGSLIYNITLSDQEEDFQRAISFCEEMGFGKFFNEFPQKYSTLVGEEGVNLSGGQKQLVGLARALYRRPKVLLLDEATSSMDRDTENFIMLLLLQVKHKTATLMVTHRIKTARVCDRIYLLKNGETSQQENFEGQFSKNILRGID